MALEPLRSVGRRRAQSRARGHDAPVLDRRSSLTVPVFVLEMGGHLTGARSDAVSATQIVELGAARAGDAGRALGRLAVLRARLAVARQPQPQHVHADRARHGRRVALQRRRDARCPASSRPRSASMDGAVPVYFEAAAVITVLVLLGQVLELRARERRPAAPSARCSTSRRRPRAASQPDGSDEDVPLDDGRGRRPPARAAGREGAGRRRGARGPQRRRRVDGHRRVDAGRRRSPATTVIGGTRQRQRRASSCAAEQGRPRHAARADRAAWSPRRSAVARPIQRLADQVSGWFVPAVIAIAVARLRRLGDLAGRSRASPTRWSPRSRCSSSPAPARSASRRRCRSWSASGAARTAGVLIKNAEALERLEKVDTLVVDKTGTLTEGKPTRVRESCPPRASTRPRCCGSPRAVERASEHPLARGDRRGAREGARARARRRSRTSTRPTGKGVTGTVERPAGRARQRRASWREHGVDVGGLADDARTSCARDGRDRDLRRRRRRVGGRPRRRRSDQGDDAGGARGAAGRGRARRHADRRQRGPRPRPSPRKLGIDEVEAEVLPEDKAARRQGAASRGPRGRHGRRRRQRRAGAGRGRRRHRDGHRHRRRDGERRRHAGQGRPARHRARAAAVARDDAQHPPEPVLRLRLQRARRADRGGRALPVLRHPAVADDRRRRDGAVVGERDRQRAPAAARGAPRATGETAQPCRRFSAALAGSEGSRGRGLRP